jgi:hypothetical protein
MTPNDLSVCRSLSRTLLCCVVDQLLVDWTTGHTPHLVPADRGPPVPLLGRGEVPSIGADFRADAW